MLSSLKVLSLLAGVGLMIALSSATTRAEDAKKETGSVTGTVVDKDGKAVAGATVAIVEPRQKGPNADSPRKPADQAAGDDAAKPKRPAPVATTETDKDGKFTLADVPVGEYVVVARLKGVGRTSPTHVTVAAGKEETVSLTLMPPGDKPAAGDRPNKKKDKAAATN
jgi:hypothetical protein